MHSIVRLERVSKRFSGREVLSGIDLEVREGELLTLLGPSGAGKTTLMRLINLFERPSEGRIYFRSMDVTNLRGRELLEVRRSMVMVFQKPVMFSGSVFHNVAYGLKIRGYARSEVERRVREALRLVGLEGYEDRNARTLSGGEAQRVAFARAAVVRPKLLLLDEPTTSLDPISEARVHGIIRRIKEELGISVVLTTHKQHEAIALGDRIAVLNHGKLQQVGSPEEVIYSPKTRFVAEFTGMVNIFEGVVEEVNREACVVKVGDARVTMRAFKASRGERVCIGIRPEEVMLLRTDVPLNPRLKNVLKGVVEEILPQGSAMLRLRISSGLEVCADVPRHVAEKMSIREGGEVLFSLKTSCLRRLE